MIRSTFLFAVAFACFVFASRAQTPNIDTNATWRVGVASVVITPPQAMWMAGYASRTNVSQGTALDLHAKALALQDEIGRAHV